MYQYYYQCCSLCIILNNFGNNKLNGKEEFFLAAVIVAVGLVGKSIELSIKPTALVLTTEGLTLIFLQKL